MRMEAEKVSVNKLIYKLNLPTDIADIYEGIRKAARYQPF